MPSTAVLRLVAIALVAAGVVLLGANVWRYGLVAQSDIVVIFIVPLVFAGLLLGRAGIWVTMAGFTPVITDTYEKADRGPEECSCRSEGSSVRSSSAVRLSRRASRV